MENQLKQVKKAPPKPMPPRPVPPKKVEQKAETLKPEYNDENVNSALENVATKEHIEEKSVETPSEAKQKSKNVKNAKEPKIKEKNKKKIAETKEPKQKKARKKLTKKGVILLVVICVALLGIGGGVAGMVIMNNANNKKLLTPSISVVQLYNGTVLEVKAEDRVTRYEFVITDENNNQSTITTTTNTVELSQYLSQAGTYSVKARVYGAGSGATSDFSESKSFVNYVALATPNIFINNMDKILEGGVELGYKTNTNKEDDTITWEAVKNASKYYVRYGVDGQTNQVKYVEVPASAGVVTFSLSSIYANGTGKYLISVIAVPEGGDGCYYLESGYQKLVSIEYYEKQSAPTSVTYNKTTKELQFTLDENGLFGDEFDLFITYIDGTTKEHKIYLNISTVENNGGVVTIKCSLQQVASGEIVSIAIVTLSDGAYSTDSDPYIWANN